MQGDSPLSDFSHRGLPRSRDPVDRLAALAATALVYCFLAMLALRPSAWIVPLQIINPPTDAIVRLLPPGPRPRMEMRDFTVRLIRPQAMNAPMPEIVIKPDASVAPKAPLPASAATASPMTGGAAQGAAAGAVNGVGTGGDGKGMAACMDMAYLLEIDRHISHWFSYPDKARSSRITGVAYVHFVIDKRGRYKELNLMQGTGNNLLDGAAMQTMRRAEPLPSIPERFHTDRLDGVLPIVYQMRGSPLMTLRLGNDPSGC